MKVILNIRLYLLCCLACIFHELNLVHYNKLWRLMMWISSFIYYCYKPKIKILNHNLMPKTFSTLLTEKTCACATTVEGNTVLRNPSRTGWHDHSLSIDDQVTVRTVIATTTNLPPIWTVFLPPLILRHWPIDCILSGWCVHKARHVAILWFFFSSDKQFTYQMQLLIWNIKWLWIQNVWLQKN